MKILSVSKVEIQPHGSFQLVNSDGFVIPIEASEVLPKAWSEIVNDVQSFYKDQLKENLHSIYIRGSVAKGEPVDFVSDLDSFAVTLDEQEIDEAVENDFRAICEAKYPFCTGVELTVSSLDQIKVVPPHRQRSIMEELIKTQSRCLYGNNLADSIAPFKLSEMIGHSLYIIDEIDNKLPLYLEEDKDSPEALKDLCGWIMRRLIRACYDHDMLEEGKFTRDLYLCVERSSYYHPPLHDDLTKALHFALNPSQNVNDWMPVVAALRQFFRPGRNG
tara:strand:- start:399 stop:1223 length:825 start_codon:yes stop_codon:yes gene_type:complete